MKNLCFIGTSHLGALAIAWNKRLAPQYPEFKASFFTGPNTSLYEAEFLPQHIKAPVGSKLETFFQLSANGQSSIELADYDYFIFQSLDFPWKGIFELANLLGTAGSEPQQFFSLASLETAITTNLERSPIKRYVEHMRNYTAAPIIVSMTAKTSILALDKHPQEYAAYLQWAEFFEDLFKQASEKVFNYPNLSLVAQPEETLANPYFTKLEYLNAYGKHELNEITDYWHKKPKYGKAVLIKILEQLKTL